ncbi:MAG: hypothetical protein JO316_06740 [Abitibacteriaceae bacterium]|nr:hypothetical protein [Abditibacteriaceae bacterium]
MARNNQALLIEALWEETERLTTTVNALQSRLAAHGDSDYATHILTVTAPTTLQPTVQAASPTPSLTASDEWNIWPYSWARNLYSTSLAHLSGWRPSLFKAGLKRGDLYSRHSQWNHSEHKRPSLKLLH